MIDGARLLIRQAGKRSDSPVVVTTAIPQPFRRSVPWPVPSRVPIRRIPPGLARRRHRPHFHPGQRLRRSRRAFYGKLFEFLGFEISDEYPSTIGWTNGQTRYWIAPAEGRKTYRIGDLGLHHYAFELRNRKDVDALQAFLEAEGVKIVDPADEYYEDYYAVFFLDPDGIKLEGMKYGELTAKRKRKPLKKKG